MSREKRKTKNGYYTDGGVRRLTPAEKFHQIQRMHADTINDIQREYNKRLADARKLYHQNMMDFDDEHPYWWEKCQDEKTPPYEYFFEVEND
jgi:hypothetical protein